MASVTAKKPCIKWDKGGGVATCGGCQQWFCVKHFSEHRQELAIGMDTLGQEHDQLQRDLIQDNDVHDLLSHVNDWEQKSIKKIQEAAERARLDVQKYLDHNKHQLQTSLDQVTVGLKLSRQSDDYTEIDLKKWIEKMQEIQEMLENPLAIRIVDDDDAQSIIHLIQVKQTATTDRAVRSSEEAASAPGPEYGTYRLQYAQDSIIDNTKKSAELVSTVNMKDHTSDRLPLNPTCRKCGREFLIDNNPGGDCIHSGTWHAKFEDCSYLKCGFNLGLKASIGRQHWSCCYSLEQKSNVCNESGPHIVIEHEN